jgi:hypothetical protein
VITLTGFFKTSGVDLLRSDVEAAIGPQPYDVRVDGLVVWFGDETEVVYDLAAEAETIRPRGVTGMPPADLPAPAKGAPEFRCRPVTWGQWVTAWERAASTERFQSGDGKD